MKDLDQRVTVKLKVEIDRESFRLFELLARNLKLIEELLKVNAEMLSEAVKSLKGAENLG